LANFKKKIKNQSKCTLRLFPIIEPILNHQFFLDKLFYQKKPIVFYPMLILISPLVTFTFDNVLIFDQLGQLKVFERFPDVLEKCQFLPFSKRYKLIFTGTARKRFPVIISGFILLLSQSNRFVLVLQ